MDGVEFDDQIEPAVELIADGEVSPYFHNVVECEDKIEVRGPIGGPFIWMTRRGRPLLLVAGVTNSVSEYIYRAIRTLG